MKSRRSQIRNYAKSSTDCRRENKQAGVKVQQILLKVARKDLDAQVEQKAKDLIAKAAAATSRKPQKKSLLTWRAETPKIPLQLRPAVICRGQSRRTRTRSMRFTIALSIWNRRTIFDIPIKYAGNWYILRRGESVPKTFEETKPELSGLAAKPRGYAAAAKLAERPRTV